MRESNTQMNIDPTQTKTRLDMNRKNVNGPTINSLNKLKLSYNNNLNMNRDVGSYSESNIKDQDNDEGERGPVGNVSNLGSSYNTIQRTSLSLNPLLTFSILSNNEPTLDFSVISHTGK